MKAVMRWVSSLYSARKTKIMSFLLWLYIVEYWRIGRHVQDLVVNTMFTLAGPKKLKVPDLEYLTPFTAYEIGNR